METGFVFCYIVLLSSFIGSLAADQEWWEAGSLYQIYPRSWKDSDGDGIGDLKGITQNLDFLKEIGMTAAWLSPIFKSPMSDFGYDISNFYDIDPLFGNLDDFDELIAKAKQIDLKIILDFVPNHSSNECDWFQKSINREDGYDDFYIWVDGLDDPNNTDSKLPPNNWNNEFGGRAWTWNEKRQQFYLHQFQPQQPDINFRNPKARKTLLDVLKFWLDRGIDGFRIDAVQFFVEKINDDGTYPDEPLSGKTNDSDSKYYLEHIYTYDQPENAELLMEWRQFVDEYKKDNGGDSRVLLAEAYSPIEALDRYYGNDTNPASDIPFNFNFILDLDENSNARDLQKSIDDWMNVMWKKHQTANWVLGNHDRPRFGDRLGKERKDLFNILVAALPGTSVTYYGEEIGMDNVERDCTNITTCDFRDPERTPFQWNNQTSAGFSDSNNTWLPISSDYKTLNVQVQRGQDRSSLNIFKRMQNLRRTSAFTAIKSEGDWSYGVVNDQVFQIIRSSAKEEYRILLNLGNGTETLAKLCGRDDKKACFMKYVVVTKYSKHEIGDKANLMKITLQPYESVVLKRTKGNK